MILLDDQKALENFFVSLQYSNPPMARIMADDIRTVALYGIAARHEHAYEEVVRLRARAQTLPIPQAKILDLALSNLGYSMLDIMQAEQRVKALVTARRSRQIHSL